jgi:hypothetical protein
LYKTFIVSNDFISNDGKSQVALLSTQHRKPRSSTRVAGVAVAGERMYADCVLNRRATNEARDGDEI